jgi:uncharacterized protein YciI
MEPEGSLPHSQEPSKHVMFLRNYKQKQNFYFCGRKILTEGVLLTQLSSNAPW